jgi:competence protein ComEC
LEENGILTAADVTEKVRFIKELRKIEAQELLEWQKRVKSESMPKSWDLLPDSYYPIRKKNQIIYEFFKAELERIKEEKTNKENARDDARRRIYQDSSFTFRSFLRKGLASKGIVAGIIGAILVFSPIFLGTCALIAAGVLPIPAVTTTIQNFGIAGLVPSKTPTNGITITVLPRPSSTISADPVPEAAATNTLIVSTTTVPVTSIQDGSATSPPFETTATVTLAETNPGGPLVITFIDVGQGDSILIAAPDGRTALIDGGGAGSGALPYLQNHGIKSIDIMIATHPDEDHIGGAVEILNAMPVKEVITNGESDTTTTYEHFLNAIANAKAEYVEVGRGDTIDIENLHFLVLNPATLSADDTNANSLVLRMSYEKTTFIFMGDADANAEVGILAAGLPVQADILKVGHHGSCESSSPAFLDTVHPQVAIYSAGINNPYGHPCTGTISALNAHGIFVYGTDTNGSVIVTVTAYGYSITGSSGVIFRK